MKRKFFEQELFPKEQVLTVVNSADSNRLSRQIVDMLIERHGKEKAKLYCEDKVNKVISKLSNSADLSTTELDDTEDELAGWGLVTTMLNTR